MRLQRAVALRVGGAHLMSGLPSGGYFRPQGVSGVLAGVLNRKPGLKRACTTPRSSPSLVSALEDVCSAQLQWRRSLSREGKRGVVDKGLLTCPDYTDCCIVRSLYGGNEF